MKNLLKVSALIFSAFTAVCLLLAIRSNLPGELIFALVFLLAYIGDALTDIVRSLWF